MAPKTTKGTLGFVSKSSPLHLFLCDGFFRMRDVGQKHQRDKTKDMRTFVNVSLQGLVTNKFLPSRSWGLEGCGLDFS